MQVFHREVFLTQWRVTLIAPRQDQMQVFHREVFLTQRFLVDPKPGCRINDVEQSSLTGGHMRSSSQLCHATSSLQD